MPRHLSDWLDERLDDPAFRAEYLLSDLRHQVAAEVTRWRLKLHLSQAELAARANVSQALVSRTENARSSPTLESIQSLANALAARAVLEFVDDGHDRTPWKVIAELTFPGPFTTGDTLPPTTAALWPHETLPIKVSVKHDR